MSTGYADVASWSGYPGTILPRASHSAVAARKEIHPGYEHRWTPDTAKEEHSVAMRSQPRDQVQVNHARHMAPAGLRMQRGVPSLDATYNTFGAANGQLLSAMPVDVSIRNRFYIESPPEEKVVSPTSATMSPSDFLPKTSREDRALAKGSVGGTFAAARGDSKGAFVRPSWQQINPNYRTDWNVTRDRYNLNSQASERTEVRLSLPIVSSPLVDTFGKPLLSSLAQVDQVLSDPQKPPGWMQHSNTQKVLNKLPSTHPSWSNITADYKHDWGLKFASVLLSRDSLLACAFVAIHSYFT